MAREFNHAYLAAQAKRLGGRVLDFGCGRAHVLRLLRADGVDAYGADVFFAGMDWSNLDAPRDLLASGAVRAIANGKLPFDDGFFDTIISDQVIEHVESLEEAIAEMGRVLKPGGRMYHQYPTLNTVREAHSSAPWAHRLPGPVRVRYLAVARRVRLIPGDIDRPQPRQYAEHMSRWIDDYCWYRSRDEIEAALASRGFVVVHCETPYCRSRAGEYGHLRALIDRYPALAARAFQVFGFDCIETAPYVRPEAAAHECAAYMRN